MDNRKIFIQAVGREQFDLAIQLAFTTEWKVQKATHYFEHPTKGLILLSREEQFYIKEVATESIPAIKLLTAMDWKLSADLAWTWLKARKDNEYQDWCDHDGSDGHGFRVYNEDWGMVADSRAAICGIQPIWAWYGK